ncbi:GntR family transcriptional regulator [Thermoanaerobacter uzonensis]|uniref:GntR family transcriptional regulator n=1 Tax=Thermoanaerobacter uzonensis TaxID=447593 RepID=UPI003D7694C7
MNNINKPLYQKICNYVLDKIKSGEYKPGDRVPSEMELAIKFNVSRITSKKALEVLANRGIVYRIAGKGSFVSDDAEKITNENIIQHLENDSSRLIGFIISDFTDTYGTGLVLGVEKEAAKLGYNVVIRRSHGDEKIEEEAINSLFSLGVDGMIIMPVHGEYYNNEILKLYLDNYPLVLLDRYLKGIPVPYVSSDNFNAAKDLTTYLFDLGHKNIALLAPPIINTSTLEERVDGFIKSHADHEIPLDQSIWLTDIKSTLPDLFTEENIEKDKNKIINLIESNPQITAIFATEYNIAYLALKALDYIGKKIPEDISIVCFDGPYMRFNDYFFTHARQNEESMGANAVVLLKKLIDGEDVPKKTLIEPQIIIGKTTSSKLLKI